MLDSSGTSFATAVIVKMILSSPNCNSRFFPIADSLPKYFFAEVSVMTIEFLLGNGLLISPCFNGKSNSLKKLLSTMLTGSLKVLLLYLSGGLNAATRQLD